MSVDSSDQQLDAAQVGRAQIRDRDGVIHPGPALRRVCIGRSAVPTGASALKPAAGKRAVGK